MASSTGNSDRATWLTQQALKLVAAGNLEEGSRKLREAISLAPDNQQVKAAFVKIQADSTIDVVLKLCERFTENNDSEAGNEAVSYITARGSQISKPIAVQCLQLLIKQKHVQDKKARDSLVAGLLLYCSGAREHLAKQLQDSLKSSFDEYYEIGDGSATGLAVAVLDPAAWATEAVRELWEKDVFRLFMAKLLESGNDHNGRAMRGVARLLTTDAAKLHAIIDEDSFDVILASLDNRLSLETRSQATLATAKYLEVLDATGQEQLSKFITTRIGNHTSDDLIIAFSAAAAVFPLVPTMASSLFLSEGFVPSLAALLEKETKSQKVEQAALDMLSAACVDSGCREAIREHCLRWLHMIIKIGQIQRQGQAAVILAKVKSTNALDKVSPLGKDAENDIGDVVPMLQGMLLDGDDTNRKISIEGLAYASMQAKVKEEIATNKALLERLTHVQDVSPLAGSLSMNVRALPSGQDPINMSVVFGTLTILENLTRYLPRLSEEQKRMSQLKSYANAAPATMQSDPLDDDDHVSDRCKSVLEANVVPYMINVEQVLKPKGLSPSNLAMMARILLSLSRTTRARGKLVQQGAILLLRSIYETKSLENHEKRLAAHALARILISVDPQLLIKDRTASIVEMVLSLLRNSDADNSDGPRDLLPEFEGLLALTNLAPDPELNAGTQIVKSIFDKIEELLLSSTPLLQRAATELLCNLMTCPLGLQKLADGSKVASRRLHIVLALADAEDIATRQAAAGALAMLTEWFEVVVKAILERERGLKILLTLCEDDEKGCVHRGVACIQNMVMTKGDVGKRACEDVRALDGVAVLRRVLVTCKSNEVIVESCINALEALT
ncbi:Protein unc-45 A [Xylographa opegraphella]|nr:Protein unc-45 A [Xylographa opegraphella]